MPRSRACAAPRECSPSARRPGLPPRLPRPVPRSPGEPPILTSAGSRSPTWSSPFRPPGPPGRPARARARSPWPPWPPRPDGPSTPWPGPCWNYGPEPPRQTRYCPDTSAARSAGAAPPAATSFPYATVWQPAESCVCPAHRIWLGSAAYPRHPGQYDVDGLAEIIQAQQRHYPLARRHGRREAVDAIAQAAHITALWARHGFYLDRRIPLIPRVARRKSPSPASSRQATAVTAVVTYPETVDLARVLAMPGSAHPGRSGRRRPPAVPAPGPLLHRDRLRARGQPLRSAVPLVPEAPRPSLTGPRRVLIALPLLSSPAWPSRRSSRLPAYPPTGPSSPARGHGGSSSETS